MLVRNKFSLTSFMCTIYTGTPQFTSELEINCFGYSTCMHLCFIYASGIHDSFARIALTTNEIINSVQHTGVETCKADVCDIGSFLFALY